ncbi:MAG TPA: molybdenum cofactor guanylyltransferase [Fimbriimonadales bacterium]|nr:molybdenum cofactor guanylyltransferase [Fimbriimonadales bacterium]
MLTDVEAVVLTGGASRRMGTDKASLVINGEPIAARTARILAEECVNVTVLGREPIEGFAFQSDPEPFPGPRRALDEFAPEFPFVFAASCDMPFFRAQVVTLLRDEIGQSDAAIPSVGGFLQPLCALYRAQSLGPFEGESSMMSLLRRLEVAVLDAGRLVSLGVDPEWIRSFNTPEELADLDNAPSARPTRYRCAPKIW